MFPAPPGEHAAGGYWIVPLSVLAGLGILVLTHRLARGFLAWWQRRRRTGAASDFVA
jgi:hypothetical protein